LLVKKIKNSVIYGLSDFAIKGTNLVLTPYYIYKLSIDEFGQYAILIAVYSLLQIVFNLGFQSGYIRYYYIWDNDDGEIISNTWILLLISSIFGVLIIAIHSLFTVELIFTNKEFIIIVITSILFATIVNNTISIFKVIEMPLRSGALGLIVSISGTSSIILLFSYSNLTGLSPIIVGNLIASIVGASYSILSNYDAIFTSAKLKSFKKILNYSAPLVWHNMFQWILNSSDRFILLILIGRESLGGYFFCYQFAIGLQFIFRSVNSSLFPMYSRIANNNNMNEYNNIYKINNYYMILVITAGSSVILFSPVIITYFKIVEYIEYIYLIPLLAGGSLFYSMYYVPMNFITLSSGKSKKVYLLTFLAAFVGILINIIFVKLSLVFAGIASFTSYLVLSVAFNNYACKIDSYKRVLNINNYLMVIVYITILSVILTVINYL
jgi:O-antigen/teichoic acid export membrane protein